MQRSKIEWVRHSDGSQGFDWNPWVGCLHGEDICAVSKKCWARGQAKRYRKKCELHYQFTPHPHHERLYEPFRRKKPTTIAVSLMGDLFGAWMPSEEIERVLIVARQCPQHRFLFLTKNPIRYREFNFPRNCWLGTTINCQADMHRLDALSVKAKETGSATFVSFEPLYEGLCVQAQKVGQYGPRWVIIGAQSRPTLLPKKEWVWGLIQDARGIGASVFLKDNLKHLKVELGNLEEMPWR